MRPSACFLFLVFFAVSNSGCSADRTKSASQVARVKSDKSSARLTQAHPEDLEFEKLLTGRSADGDRAAEARDWLDLKHTNHALWKTDREQTLKIVNDLYAAGAAKVYAVYAPADETIRVHLCASLLIKLPENAQQRQRVLRAFNHISREFWGEDHEEQKDQGQKYLLLDMDS